VSQCGENPDRGVQARHDVGHGDRILPSRPVVALAGHARQAARPDGEIASLRVTYGPV
jgi:hypothetical protein